MNTEFFSRFEPLKRLFFRFWRPGLLVLSLATIAYLLYFRRLGLLLPGYSTNELQTFTSSTDWHKLVNNPVDLPYKLLVWLFSAIGHHSILAARVVAACFGTLAALTFFLVIRGWYTFRVAFLGTVLFATSAGFLHSARMGTAEILQMAVLGLLAFVGWYRENRDHRPLIGYGLAAILALLWYVPGMLWLELFGALVAWKIVVHQLRRVPLKHTLGWSGVFLAVLAPLIYASVRDPGILLAAGGLPNSLSDITHWPQNALDAVLSVGIRSDGNPLHWVGHVPLLNAAELVLGAIGLYYYVYQERSMQAWYLTGSVFICWLLISFHGSVGFAAVLPLFYLFIIHGLDHFLVRWMTVFPRNPIARLTGIGVVSLLLFFSVLYQTRAYFVAWPHNTAVRAAYSLPKP
ncbi:MAG TPA: hypothetical protein VLF40_04555 [Candidatus Saccharimonadales bacterium]|nr:hypothetical protein [Candidatus Saccharimonadales bacterium]